MPVCSPRTAAAAANGARPSSWPPSSVQARARARMAVVLPAPAGAIASCKRAPDVLICQTRDACPASSALPVAAISSKARSTAVRSTDAPPQRFGFLDVVVRRGQGNRPTIEHLIDQQVDECRGMFRGHVDGADLSLCFGPDMPYLPRRAARLDDGQDVISGMCDRVC